jgi:hypothetical protein
LQVLSIRSVPLTGGAFKTVAHFDAQIFDGLQRRDLRLVEAPDGKVLVYAPSKHGRKFAGFTTEFGSRLAAIAIAALRGGCVANDRYT